MQVPDGDQAVPAKDSPASNGLEHRSQARSAGTSRTVS